MEDDKKTLCECPMAGYCERHGVTKSKHLHKLCKNHLGYFNMWEQCVGPRQNPHDCKKQTNTKVSPKINKESEELPSTLQMAKNFVKSAAKHVASGMGQVSEEEQKNRLDICNACEFAVQEKSRCGKCGCFLQTKTKWSTSTCPIGKW
jgi:hypothetical protein